MSVRTFSGVVFQMATIDLFIPLLYRLSLSPGTVSADEKA
jgi:hypothetical protein